MILVPVSRSEGHTAAIEQGGFIATTIIQLATSYVLYLALHHESQFRSSGTCPCCVCVRDSVVHCTVDWVNTIVATCQGWFYHSITIQKWGYIECFQLYREMHCHYRGGTVPPLNNIERKLVRECVGMNGGVIVSLTRWCYGGRYAGSEGLCSAGWDGVMEPGEGMQGVGDG